MAVEDDSSSSSSEVSAKRRRRLPLPACVLKLFGESSRDGDALVLAHPVAVQVVLGPELRLCVLEASPARQEAGIEQAVDSERQNLLQLDGEHRGLLDPYGLAIWPSALVLAQGVASYAAETFTGSRRRLLELGAGCGMVSLAAAQLGFEVLSTDFRSSLLCLVAASARRQDLSKRVQTRLLDICDLSTPLPPADVVVAADVLYDARTAKAMAERVAEAHLRGSVVLLADVGRPNRRLFLSRLLQLLPSLAKRLPGFDFPIEGLAVQETDGAEVEHRHVPVQLLEIPFDGPAAEKVRAQFPAKCIRPAAVGTASVVESTCWVSDARSASEPDRKSVV